MRNLVIRLWNTKLGRYICQVTTLGEHVWTGWSNQGYVPGSGKSFPFAYCVRCGHEF